jgi:putative membrane protein
MMLHGGAAAVARSGSLSLFGADVPIVPAVGLAIAAVLYLRGGRTARRQFSAPRPVAFAAGWGALALALASPLHAAGGRLLSMHMIQHVIVVAVAAPLLVWSKPVGVMLRGMPSYPRNAAVTCIRRTARIRRAAVGAGPACVLLAAALWLWHMPALYDASVRHAFVHALQHSTFLVASLLYWSSIPLHVRARTAAAQSRMTQAVASLFITTVHMGLLSALLTFARVPLYSAYVSNSTSVALADQQLAGVIMWVPGAIPFIAAALFLVWILLHDEAGARAGSAAPRRQAVRATVVLLACCAVVPAAACSRTNYDEGSVIAGGNARRGQGLVKSYGCVACHIVPGVPGGDATVGPSLAGFRERQLIGGTAAQSADNLAQWIHDPKSLDSLTMMPNVGVTPTDARDIASYLYSIR